MTKYNSVRDLMASYRMLALLVLALMLPVELLVFHKADIGSGSASSDAPTLQQQEIQRRRLEKEARADRFSPCTFAQKKATFLQTDRCDMLFTSCPNSTRWLENYYLKVEAQATDNFLAVNVGCNKGYDALRLLQMGTRQTDISRQGWKNAAFSAKKSSLRAICKGDVGDESLPIPDNSKPSRGDVYCIEPMPATIYGLRHAANITQYDRKGFHVAQAVIGNRRGTFPFPAGGKLGYEGYGLWHKWRKKGKTYMDVPLMTLDDFAEKHMSRANQKQIVNVLLIDAEGADFDVLKGASDLLDRTEYLEFEFNTMFPWAIQSLEHAINYLDDKGFTCYWAGQNHLWRITGCWQDCFGIHTWSNVACVHNQRKPGLAKHMELIFVDTLVHGPDTVSAAK